MFCPLCGANVGDGKMEQTFDDKTEQYSLRCRSHGKMYVRIPEEDPKECPICGEEIEGETKCIRKYCSECCTEALHAEGRLNA